VTEVDPEGSESEERDHQGTHAFWGYVLLTVAFVAFGLVPLVLALHGLFTGESTFLFTRGGSSTAYRASEPFRYWSNVLIELLWGGAVVVFYVRVLMSPRRDKTDK